MSDGPPAATIVIRTHHELTIFRAMLDKHEKGTNATINTVESFGGGRESLDDVLAHLALWKRQAALQHELLSPKGDAAAKGTPLGDALVDAASDATGIRVAAWVPRPLPDAGQLIRWPGGTATSIASRLGFRHPELKGDERTIDLDLAARLLDEGAYEVTDSEGWQGLVQSHVDDAGAVEWRVRHSDGHEVYDTPRRVPPTTLSDAVDAITGRDAVDTSSGEDVLDDYATGTAQGASEQDTPPETLASPKGKRAAKKAAAHPGPVAEGVTKSTQRERNAHAAGVTRPAPKPTQKRAGRKGGR